MCFGSAGIESSPASGYGATLCVCPVYFPIGWINKADTRGGLIVGQESQRFVADKKVVCKHHYEKNASADNLEHGKTSTESRPSNEHVMVKS